MNYGIPYMGSKSSIAEKVCRAFPAADNFYDVFGGGFSISHFMLMHRRKDYKNFHFNEIKPGICELIKDAMAGKYSYENFKPKFISREEFNRAKENDQYVKIIWSFGNNGKSYIFGKDIENHKRSMHNAVVFNDFDSTAKELFGMDKFKDGYSIYDKRLLLRSRVKFLHSDKRAGEIEKLQQLQQLERIQQLQQLEQLERLDKLSFYNKSYEQLEIKENSVVYCDPPYAGTAEYSGSFDTKKFLNWAAELNHPVFISEYNISDKRFKQILSIKKRSLLSKKTIENTTHNQECVYVNDIAYNKVMHSMKAQRSK